MFRGPFSRTPFGRGIQYGKIAEGGSEAIIIITPEASGLKIKIASGGSEVSLITSAEGAGIKTALGGSEVIIAVSAEGAGQKTYAQGYSEATISVGVEGVGIKQARSPPGAEAQVIISAEGAGFVIDYTTHIFVSAEGAGVKIAQDGSDAGVNIETEGTGIKAALGGAEAALQVTTEGAGIKIAGTEAGAEAGITVTPEGGAGVKIAAGGSEATVEVSAEGAGTSAASGGSEAIVSVVTEGAGLKPAQGGSEATVVISTEGTGEKVVGPALQPARQLRAKVFINEVEYDDSNIISIVLDETVNPSDSFMIGAAASAKLELTLIDVNEDFDGAVIRPHLGFVVKGEVKEYVPLGVFNVEEIAWKKNKVTLTCFDNMVRLEKAYILSGLEYPATLRDVAAEIAQKAGVTFNAESLAALPTTPVPELMGYTLREAIGFVASYMGGFACFNRAGELEVSTYLSRRAAQGTLPDISPANCFSFEIAEKNFAIGRLACQAGEDEEGNPLVLVSGFTGNEITFENPWMTQTRLDVLLAELSQLSYMPYTLSWQGDPALRAGDTVSIADRKGSIFTTLIMEQSLRYDGGLTATAEAKGKTEMAQEFQSAGPLTLKLSRQSSVKAYADRLVQMLADGEFEDGTFIDGNMVISPIIAGMEGRFSGELKVGTGNDLAGISGDGSAASSIRFWAGHATKTSAPFRVTQDGSLTASKATITGTINATGGTFSGNITVTGTMSGGTISGSHFSGGSINIGSGSFIVSSLGSISGANGNFYVPYNGDGVYNDYNGVARWKYTDAHYIRQDENYIDLYQGNGIIFRFDHESFSGHSRMRFADGCLKSLYGTERLQVRNYNDSGYIPIWASQFYEPSKSEYKKNIQPAESMLGKVANIPVYNYDRKRDRPDPDEPPEIGLIWEQMPEDLRHPDGGLNLGTLIGVLWKAVQELSAEVEALKFGKSGGDA